MVDGPGPLPDSRWELAALLVIAAAVVAGFAQFTTLDGHVRFAASDPAGYFLGGDGVALSAASERSDLGVVMLQEADRQYLNRVASRSLHAGPADERLFCFAVEDGTITNLRLADWIEESTRTSISGGCTTQFRVDTVDGFMHTHPRGDDRLSEEDRNVDASIAYSCLIYDEIVEAPSGSVGGLDCYTVEGMGEDAVFEEIPVRIHS